MMPGYRRLLVGALVALFVSWAGLAAFGQSNPAEPPEWGGQAALTPEAVAQLGLQLGVMASDLPFCWPDSTAAPGPADIPAGYKVLRAAGRVCLLPVTPLLATEDIARVTWKPGTQYLTTTGELTGGPLLTVTFGEEAIAKARQVQQAGGALVLSSGDDVIAWPWQEQRTLATSFLLTDLPCDRQAALLNCLFAGAESLPTAREDGSFEPRQLAGLGRVTVQGRFADGHKSTSLRCGRFEPYGSDEGGPYGAVSPTVIAGDSGFTVINVPPGTWRCAIVGEDFALESPVARKLNVGPGENVQLNLTLRPGATVSGRVVQASDGQPVEGVAVLGGLRGVVTDAEGRFVRQHVRTDKPGLVIRDPRYVSRYVSLEGLQENETFELPDIKLERGGFITGRVAPAAEMAPQRPWVGAVAPAFLRPQYLYSTAVDRDDLSFRMGPLPAGTYNLEALLNAYSLDRCGTRATWEGQSGWVRVEDGQEVTDVVVPIAETEDW